MVEVQILNEESLEASQMILFLNKYYSIMLNIIKISIDVFNINNLIIENEK